MTVAKKDRVRYTVEQKIHKGPSLGQVNVEAVGGSSEDVQVADTEQAGAAEGAEDAKSEVCVLAGP